MTQITDKNKKILQTEIDSLTDDIKNLTNAVEHLTKKRDALAKLMKDCNDS